MGGKGRAVVATVVARLGVVDWAATHDASLSVHRLIGERDIAMEDTKTDGLRDGRKRGRRVSGVRPAAAATGRRIQG